MAVKEMFYCKPMVLKLIILVDVYIQGRGHNIANTDPLGITFADLDNTTPQELILSSYNLGMSVCVQIACTNHNHIGRPVFRYS